MATLQKIRSKGPLLLIIIGLAMLAFILGDAWKVIRPNQGVQFVGSISGDDITAADYQDEIEKYSDAIKFANNISELSEEQNASLRDEVWAMMVRNKILKEQADAIGLTVTDAEVISVIEEGSDPMLSQSPIFRREDGSFDSDYLKRFIAEYTQMDRSIMDPEYLYQADMAYKFWLFLENDIKTGLLYDKYISLVKGALVANPISAKNSFENRIKRADALVALMPYSAIDDADVTVNASDLKEVYNDNKESLYRYSETRDIYYIDYEIVPSQADREASMAEVNELTSQLEELNEDYAAFLRRHNSVEGFSEVARQARNLPEDVALRLDSVNQSGVFGPYYNAEDDSYNAFKLLGTVRGYDSIQCSMMQVIADDDAARQQRTDSIINAVRKGGDFAAIASNYQQTAVEQWYSADSYEPQIITDENAVFINKLNSMKKGEIAALDLGQNRLIIKVLDVKTPVTKYNTVVLKRPAEFSEATSDAAYDKLSRFISQNNTLDTLKANAENSDFHLLYYPRFENTSYYVGGVGRSHDALRWAFEAKEGDVSRIFEVGNNNDHLLVVAVDKINNRGYASLEESTSSISLEAIKNKKSEVMKQKMGSLSIDELKSVSGVQFDTVRFLNFTNDAYISQISSNESVIGPSIMKIDKDAQTIPMQGTECVFVAKKISDDSYTATYDETSEKLRVKTIITSQIPDRILSSLYYNAKVVDNRYKTF